MDWATILLAASAVVYYQYAKMDAGYTATRMIPISGLVLSQRGMHEFEMRRPAKSGLHMQTGRRNPCECGG